MKKYIFIISILTLLLVSACNIDFGDLAESVDEETAAKLSDAVVKCDDPYIRHGSECCLDQNANAICDEDEAIGVPDVVDDAMDDAVDDALEDAIADGDLDLSPDAELSYPEEMGWVVYEESEWEGEIYYNLGSCVDSDLEGRDNLDSDGYGLAGTVTLIDEFGVETVYTDSCADDEQYLTEYSCEYIYDNDGNSRPSYTEEVFSCGMAGARTCVDNTCTGYSSRYD